MVCNVRAVQMSDNDALPLVKKWPNLSKALSSECVQLKSSQKMMMMTSCVFWPRGQLRCLRHLPGRIWRRWQTQGPAMFSRWDTAALCVLYHNTYISSNLSCYLSIRTGLVWFWRYRPFLEYNGTKSNSAYGAKKGTRGNTPQKSLSPAIMTQLLMVIHRPCCEQFHVGTIFFPRAVQKEACINSWMTG